MAHHDALTGLPNRVLLKAKGEELLLQSKKDSQKFALLFIDLDGFKMINDSLGHTVGDSVLQIIAQRLLNTLRMSDTLSRNGSDEFIVLLPNITDMSEVVTITNQVIQKFKESFNINNQILSTTASIGIAVYPEHGVTFEQLLQNADAAMYKAKENGKNNYCFFTQQMKHNLVGLFKMQNNLKNAIKNKEFVLHYQPQVDLVENKIIGAEALIRWQHPLMGMIPPLQFISIAENSGLIVPIGEWVIYEACRQGAIWNKEGKEIVVAVNVSAVQFKRGNLLDVVKNALAVSKLDPKYLELELTESILINDTENVLETVKGIKELGIQLSIDDFGTGYSSLAYLKRFAVDKLKIDQSFVRDIINDKEDASIVKTIIQMAKSFNLKSIAEGVENGEVLKVLGEFGCDEVQGYHFAKPMVVEEFSNYYENIHSRK
jgi:diguanylate cyclase